MGDGWRPLVVGGIVVAVIVSAANRSDESAQAADGGSIPVASASSTPVPTTSANVPAAEPPPEAGAPVAEVDELGTRRLTGHEDAATVALTFDDGPHRRHTTEVLAILRDKGVTATFCVVGAQVSVHPELVNAIVAGGHVLCNHTVTHDAGLRFKRAGVIAAEVDDTQKAILAAAPDADIRFFRAPGGYFAKNLNQAASAHDLEPLAWSIDTNDWRKPGVSAIHRTVTSSIHPGAVVLLHDGGGDRSQTVAALPEIIDSLAGRGYTFVVPES